MGDVEAWFFLDSVDEARLANPLYFKRALRRLGKAINSAAKRARVFISARVSDWRAVSDLVMVAEL